MKNVTCIVVDGGYAGIHAVKAIRKSFSRMRNIRLRIVLIDKNHCRIPCPMIFLLSGSAASCESLNPSKELFLFDMDAATKIRTTWQANLRKAASESDPIERQRLMTIAVAGAGISGIETAAELAFITREYAKKRGLDPTDMRIYLMNPHNRLFHEGPPKVGHRVERLLVSYGVTVLHGYKVLHEKDGMLSCSNSQKLKTGLCIWTLGLIPNPMLRNMGLPLTPEGYVKVDERYRVQGARGVY